MSRQLDEAIKYYTAKLENLKQCKVIHDFTIDRKLDNFNIVAYFSEYVAITIIDVFEKSPDEVCEHIYNACVNRKKRKGRK